MTVIRGKTFKKDEIVPMDDHFYVDCKGEACELMFGGGDFGWRNTHFQNAKITFMGPARRTMDFAQHLGLKLQAISQPVTPPEKVN